MSGYYTLTEQVPESREGIAIALADQLTTLEGLLEPYYGRTLSANERKDYYAAMRVFLATIKQFEKLLPKPCEGEAPDVLTSFNAPATGGSQSVYDKWAECGLLRLCAGNSIDYSDVTAWFVETVRQYDLFPAWVYYDSYSARYFVEEMQVQGFNMVRCIQGAKTLSLPMQMLGVDLQAHKVVYNDNPILKWCLTNTGVQTDRNGNIVPIKNQSPRQRIDGAAALLDCYVGLYEHYNEFTGAI